MTIEVKDSTIDNAGKGIYSTSLIRKGGLICEYPGEIFTDEDKKFHSADHTYRIEIPAETSQTGHTVKRFLDAKKVPLDHAIQTQKLAHIANDRIVGNNAIFDLTYMDDGSIKVHLIAEQPIYPGNEIFVSYGLSYWREERMHLLYDRSMLAYLQRIICIEDEMNQRYNQRYNHAGNENPIDIRFVDGPNSFRLGMDGMTARQLGCRCHQGSHKDKIETIVMKVDAFLRYSNEREENILLVRCTECAHDLSISNETSDNFHKSIVFSNNIRDTSVSDQIRSVRRRIIPQKISD